MAGSEQFLCCFFSCATYLNPFFYTVAKPAEMGSARALSSFLVVYNSSSTSSSNSSSSSRGSSSSSSSSSSKLW